MRPKALERPLGLLRSRRARLFVLLSVVGPGIITGTVDNDATGITGYALAGSQFGYDLLWLLIVTAVCLAVIQEMVARMGTITGKGLSDLIRERFGVAPTVWVMILLFIANAATTVAEFAGIAGASQLLFGEFARYVAIPVSAFFVIVPTGASFFFPQTPVDPSDPSASARIALGLKPLAGQFAEQLFAIGLLTASLMGASVLPLSTTYAITEAFGFERGIDKSFGEAPAFLTIYTTMIVLGAGIALFPDAPLALITNLPNIVNGMLLPLLLPILVVLASDKRIMGRYANTRLFNVASGAVFVFLTLVTLAFLASVFFPGLFRG